MRPYGFFLWMKVLSLSPLYDKSFTVTDRGVDPRAIGSCDEFVHENIAPGNALSFNVFWLMAIFFYWPSPSQAYKPDKHAS